MKIFNSCYLSNAGVDVFFEDSLDLEMSESGRLRREHSVKVKQKLCCLHFPSQDSEFLLQYDSFRVRPY